MTESEYWGLVYGVARSLVTSYGKDWDAWEDNIDELLGRTGWVSGYSVEIHLDVLKHGETQADPEDVYDELAECTEAFRGNWKNVLGITAYLTLLGDITTAAEKLAANLPPDAVGTAYDQES